MNETSDKLAEALRESLPYLRDEAAKYDDNGGNKSLELLLRRIEALLQAHAAEAAIVPQRGLLCGTTPDGRHYALRGTPESVSAVSDLIEQATSQDAQPAAQAFPTDDQILRFLVESEAMLIADEEDLLPLIREAIAAFAHAAMAQEGQQ